MIKRSAKPKTAKPKTVAEYISSAPKEAQKKLREMYTVVRKAAPKAEEGIKWAMPAFSYDSILVMFAAFKKHIGLYPTPSVTKAFAKEFAKYKTGRGSIQFPLDKALPVALIKKIVAFRVKESKEKDKKWKSR